MKKFKRTMLGFTAAATLLSGAAVIGTTFNQTQNTSSQTILSNENAKASSHVLPTLPSQTQGLQINYSNGYNLGRDYKRNNDACKGKNGVLVPLVTPSAQGLTLAYINSQTGVEQWNINSIKGVMGIRYVNTANPYFVVLMRTISNNNFNEITIAAIRESDGYTLSSNVISGIGSDYVSYGLSQCSNNQLKFTIEPRAAYYATNRNAYTYDVAFSNDGKGIVVNSLNGKIIDASWVSSNYTYLIGSGSYILGQDVYNVRILATNSGSNPIYIYVYKNWQFYSSFNTGVNYGDLSIKSPSGFNTSFVSSLPNEIYVGVTSGNGKTTLDMATFATGGEACLVGASLDLTTSSKTWNNATVQFQPGSSITTNPPADLDISTFSIIGDKFVAASSYNVFGNNSWNDGGGAFVGSFKDLMFNPSYWNWKSNNDSSTVKFYQTGKDAVSFGDTLSLNMMLDVNGNYGFVQGNSLFLVNPNYNNNNSGWAYQTALLRKIPSNFNIPGVENVQLNQSMINNFETTLNDNGVLNYIKSSFLNLRQDSTFTVTPINVTGNNQYQGSVSFSLSISNIFMNGNLVPNYVFPQTFSISGYRKYVTTMPTSSFQIKNKSDIYAEEFSDQTFIDGIRKNIQKLFVDIPAGVDLSQVRIEVSNSFFGNYKTAQIYLPESYNSKSELVTSPVAYTLTLNGFKFNYPVLAGIIIGIVLVIMIVSAIVYFTRRNKTIKKYKKTVLTDDYTRHYHDYN